VYAQLIAIAGLAALIAALMGWAMARRYGRRRALVVPMLAIAAAIVSVFRANGLEPDDALPRLAIAMALTGPAVAGALVGLMVAGKGP
jgi:uncharacterized membrane protein YfcA